MVVVHSIGCNRGESKVMRSYHPDQGGGVYCLQPQMRSLYGACHSPDLRQDRLQLGVEMTTLSFGENLKQFVRRLASHQLFAQFFGAVEFVDVDFAEFIERWNWPLIVFPSVGK